MSCGVVRTVTSSCSPNAVVFLVRIKTSDAHKLSAPLVDTPIENKREFGVAYKARQFARTNLD
jgi:hypothetical protein